MTKSYLKFIRKKAKKIIIALLILPVFTSFCFGKSNYTLPVKTPTPQPTPTPSASVDNQEFLLWSN